MQGEGHVSVVQLKVCTPDAGERPVLLFRKLGLQTLPEELGSAVPHASRGCEKRADDPAHGFWRVSAEAGRSDVVGDSESVGRPSI